MRIDLSSSRTGITTLIFMCQLSFESRPRYIQQKRTNAVDEYSPNIFSWVAFFDSGRVKEVMGAHWNAAAQQGGPIAKNLCVKGSTLPPHRPSPALVKSTGRCSPNRFPAR